MQVQVVGIAWYRREHYSALLLMFEDGDKLPGSYDEWLRRAEGTRKGLEAKGVRVVRAYIDPDEFPRWCRSKGLNVDADARMAFSSEIAREHAHRPN